MENDASPHIIAIDSHSQPSRHGDARHDRTGTAAPTKFKVLVVDDEHIIADTLAQILNQSGFEARAAFSGTEAVNLLDVFPPDLIISDVIMPDMNGIEAAIIIRSKLPNCKILLLSGQAVTVDLLEVASAQGYEFEILAKPIHPTDLLSKLRSLTGSAVRTAV